MSKLVPDLEIRYVLFHNEKGIYLGGGEWSYGPTRLKSAITFAKESGEVVKVKFPGSELHEVHEDLPNRMASIEACANVGLPRWGETYIENIMPADLEGGEV